MKTVFMGTPDFALPALNALHQSDHAVELVITQPDRPVGRGRRISSPPVKTAATALDLPLAQVPDMKHPAILDRLGDIAPDILVVVAFGHRLPAAVLEIPALMPINIHASLLPRYRGPAPIQWAIINGETESGVTTMRMDTGMDTGDILMRAPTPIGPKESAGLLHDRLAAMGAALLLKTLSALEQGSLAPQPQNHDRPPMRRCSPKPTAALTGQCPPAQSSGASGGSTPGRGHTHSTATGVCV